MRPRAASSARASSASRARVGLAAEFQLRAQWSRWLVCGLSETVRPFNQRDLWGRVLGWGMRNMPRVQCASAAPTSEPGLGSIRRRSGARIEHQLAVASAYEAAADHAPARRHVETAPPLHLTSSRNRLRQGDRYVHWSIIHIDRYIRLRSSRQLLRPHEERPANARALSEYGPVDHLDQQAGASRTKSRQRRNRVQLVKKTRSNARR
jgi:hypothetical protein